MVIFILLLILAASALILISALGVPELTVKPVILPEAGPPAEKTKIAYSFLDIIFPFSGKILEKLKLDAKIKNRLEAAHVRLSAQGFFNLTIISMLFFGISGYIIFGRFDYRVALAVAAGFFFPNSWVNKKIAKRKRAIIRFLPETIDLLGLCVEAGLDFTSAVKWVIKSASPNPVIDELAFVAEQINWGKPRQEALKDMSKRLNTPEVASFVQALVQAERMGTPVSEAFAIISEDTRLQRFRRGERLALQAPMKILLPLVFCIFPVIAIIVGGPIFLQFMQGNIFKGF